MKFYRNPTFAFGLLVLLTAAGPLAAEISVSEIFQNQMVLQRDVEHPVWGWGEPGENVNVEFAGQKVSAQTGKDGRWEVRLAPLKASATGRTLTISGAKNRIRFGNVLVGDVWLCSGQSNMEMPFKWGVIGGEEARRETEKFPQIRFMRFLKLKTFYPLEHSHNTGWKICNKDNLQYVSAVAYFFAREICRETGIPIGLLGNNWSGCYIEPYLSLESLEQIPELKTFADFVHQVRARDTERDFQELKQWVADSEVRREAGLPLRNPPLVFDPDRLRDKRYVSITTQYNAMIAPITRFPIRGCIWYQGESNANAGEGVEYFHKMRALIQGWRSAWQQEFPFYFVQLSSFGKVEEKPEGEFSWSSVREMQSRALELPKTGMAVTIDIGDSANIHPGNKLDVGKRLALWALKNEYGQTNLCPSGPLYRDMRKEKGGIRIRFHYAQSGLMVGEKKGIAPVRAVPGGRLKQFAIAGADRKWYWADARIEGSDVFVSSPHVPDPVAVRYAFRKNPQGANLYNREGLPASPFRTDSWE